MVDVIFAIVIALVIGSVIYGGIRAFWRLRSGDVEEAGNDGRTIGR
jgi:hypothetical protein